MVFKIVRCTMKMKKRLLFFSPLELSKKKKNELNTFGVCENHLNQVVQ